MSLRSRSQCLDSEVDEIEHDYRVFAERSQQAWLVPFSEGFNDVDQTMHSRGRPSPVCPSGGLVSFAVQQIAMSGRCRDFKRAMCKASGRSDMSGLS